MTAEGNLDIASPLGGFDLEIELASSLTSGQRIDIITDIAIVEEEATSTIRVSNSSGSIYLTLFHEDVPSEIFLCYGAHSPKHIRVVYYHEFIAVELDELWQHTFYPSYVYYNTDVATVHIRPNYSATVDSVRKRELSDWREAIFIDLETATANAIAGVIQQRPVEIYGRWDGSVRYQYTPLVRSTLDIKEFVHDYTIDQEENQQTAAEAIVYYIKTGMVVDPESFKRIGFVTRVYRLPDLDSGGLRAASISQLRARQQMKNHTIIGRLDPRLELGDVALVGTIGDPLRVPPNAKLLVEAAIIESLQISIDGKKASMTIRGRNYE